MSAVQTVTPIAFDSFEQISLTVGTVEVSFPIQTVKTSIPEKIFVQAAAANTDSIFVGKTGVQSDYSTGAFEFPPGANYEVPITKAGVLKAISSAAGQVLLITYLWESSR
jgi:hypothetical protein